MFKNTVGAYWQKIPSWVRNPYLIAFIVFAVWMTFFDEHNLATQWERKNEVAALDDKINFYQSSIRTTRKELKELSTNPTTQEKFAREHYYMKRDNEDVYVFRTFETEKPQQLSWWQRIFR